MHTSVLSSVYSQERGSGSLGNYNNLGPLRRSFCMNQAHPLHLAPRNGRSAQVSLCCICSLDNTLVLHDTHNYIYYISISKTQIRASRAPALTATVAYLRVGALHAFTHPARKVIQEREGIGNDSCETESNKGHFTEAGK